MWLSYDKLQLFLYVYISKSIKKTSSRKERKWYDNKELTFAFEGTNIWINGFEIR